MINVQLALAQIPNGKLNYKVSISPNQINWQQFGNFSLPDKLIAIWGFGNPRFSNEKGFPTDALSHGWTHTDSPNLTGSSRLPMAKISGFRMVEQMLNCCVVNDLIKEGKPEAQYFNTEKPNLEAISPKLAQEAGAKAYYHAWGEYDPDKKSNAPRNSFIILDQELDWRASSATRGKVMANLIKGMHSVKGNNPLITCYYGNPVSRFIGSFNQAAYDGSAIDEEHKFSPYYSESEKASFKINTGVLNETFKEYVNYFAIDPYFKVPYPKNETLYRKNADGSYFLNNGKRVWRITSYQEIIDGSPTNVYATPQAGTEDWYHGFYLPESWFAVRQFYNLYDRIVYNRYALRNFLKIGEDLSQIDESNIRLMTLLRDETEPTFFSLTTEKRQLSANIGEFFIGCTFGTGIRAYYTWTTYGNRTHPSQRNDYSARTYGEDYYVMGEKPQKRYWGFFEGLTAGLKFISEAHQKYQFFDGNEKIILATEPNNTTHEIILCGQIRENKLFIFAKAPYFDKEDKTTISISNRINSDIQQIELIGRENLWQMITLPAGKYAPSDIKFEYKDELGNIHKVTGDLQRHFIR